MREFLSDAKLRAVPNDQFPDKFNAWLDWATKKVNWYDPYVESQDELLVDVDRESLAFKKTRRTEDLFNWQS